MKKLALSLYRRHVPLINVEHAILLGAARKYASWLEHGQGTPISSLHYFADLFREVQQEISPQYWNYIACKVKTFEQRWPGSVSTGAEANKHVGEGQIGGCYGSTESAITLLAHPEAKFLAININHHKEPESKKRSRGLGNWKP